MALFGRFVFVATALAVASAPVRAQSPVFSPSAGCEVDASKGNLARASFAFQQVAAHQGSPAVRTDLANTVKSLEAAATEDATTQALMLAQVLGTWLAQPNVGLNPTRGSLGFTKNPTATIALVPTIDSLFTVAEKAKPGCANLRAEVSGFYVLLNSAIAALNAQKLDSAAAIAELAGRINKSSPYLGMILGNIASVRGEEAKSVEQWTAAVALAAKDTLYRDVEKQILPNLAIHYFNKAGVAQGAERATNARKAVEIYKRLTTLAGDKAVPLPQLQTALWMAGDTAAVVASYGPMLATPAKYSAVDLFASGKNALRIGRTKDAEALLAATLAQNPNYNEALFYAAILNSDQQNWAAVIPYATRLVALEPAHPEYYSLLVRSYQGLGKVAEKAKKNAIVVAYNDSIRTALRLGNNLPVDVTVDAPTLSEKQLALTGTVTDRRDQIVTDNSARGKAKPNNAPTAVTIIFEALDKAGAVVGTTTVTTEPLTPGKSATFKATIPAANAVAYRYRLGA